MTAGTYLPTGVCDQGSAGKLGIPVAYLRRLREQRPARRSQLAEGASAGGGRPGWMHG
jgi:hypothetical protein